MNALQGYLEKLGSNFFVAAFIPSLTFMTACMFIFEPIIPPKVLEQLQMSLNPLNQAGLMLFLGAVVLAFTLSSLNTNIYKFFEGYLLLNKIPIFRATQLHRAKQLRERYESLDNQIKRIKSRLERFERAKPLMLNEKRKEQIQLRIAVLEAERDALVIEYDLHFPPQDNLILPTRFGNILRAAESYPNSRYSIDAVPIWPRMIHVVDETYMRKVNSANDECSFFLNTSFLSAVFGFLAWIAALYQIFMAFLKSRDISQIVYFWTIDAELPTYLERAAIYIIIGAVVLIIARLFYNGSLLNVSKYGNLIRSTYDLFRFKLLEQLHLELPENLRREKITWSKVSELFTMGETHAPLDFTYLHSNAAASQATTSDSVDNSNNATKA